MVFLVVDNNLERMWQLVDMLRQLSPDYIVEYTHDSLMAGRFAANKHVDFLLCDYNTQPVSGAQLYNVVRSVQPSTQTLILTDDEKATCVHKRPVTLRALEELITQYIGIKQSEIAKVI